MRQGKLSLAIKTIRPVHYWNWLKQPQKHISRISYNGVCCYNFYLLLLLLLLKVASRTRTQLEKELGARLGKSVVRSCTATNKLAATDKPQYEQG